MLNPVFTKALEIVLKNEGGYVNDPRDNGGETKYGISKKSYPNLDIKNLTLQQASDIYYRDYWSPIKADKIPCKSSIILFDMAVNMGISRAVKLLQKVVDMPQDGIIGPGTIGKSLQMGDIPLCSALTAARIGYYVSLPSFSVYGNGWTRRSIETLSGALT